MTQLSTSPKNVKELITRSSEGFMYLQLGVACETFYIEVYQIRRISSSGNCVKHCRSLRYLSRRI